MPSPESPAGRPPPPSGKRVSIVVPIFNEETNLPELRARLSKVFSAQPGMEFEVVLVDDHSLDGTPLFCRGWAAEDPRVRYVRFSRNFGSHAALMAGLERASGDSAVLMAADLQDPPEDLPRLIGAWEEGAQVVWAVRAAREGESMGTTLSARVYYLVMRRIAGLQLPPEGADFVLVDRTVREALLTFRERSNSLFAILCWSGFRQAAVSYSKKARAGGKSGWTFRKKVRLFMDSVIGFTPWPMRLLGVLGGLCAGAGFLYSVVLVYLRIRGEIEVQGWTALMVVSLLGFGTMMVMTGVLGEYLWRTLEEVRARPRYLVEEEVCTSTSRSR